MGETVSTPGGIVGVAARYVVEPTDWVDMPEASPRVRARVAAGDPAVTVVIDITGKIHTVPGAQVEVDPYADAKYDGVREEGRRRFGQASGLDVDVRTGTVRAAGRPELVEQYDPRDRMHGAEFEAYDAAEPRDPAHYEHPDTGDEPHGHHPVWLG